MTHVNWGYFGRSTYRLFVEVVMMDSRGGEFGYVGCLDHLGFLPFLCPS